MIRYHYCCLVKGVMIRIIIVAWYCILHNGGAIRPQCVLLAPKLGCPRVGGVEIIGVAFEPIDRSQSSVSSTGGPTLTDASLGSKRSFTGAYLQNQRPNCETNALTTALHNRRVDSDVS
jgi:hypothetical protein